MSDLNLCQFIGRLGQDPEQRFLPSGVAVCNFSIAVGETWKDKATGEKQEKTEWVRVTAFARLAEICAQYLRKGSQVYVAGTMQTRKWQAQDGTDRYSTEIKLDQMQMLGGKAEGQSQPGHPAPQQQRQAERQQPAHTQAQQQAPAQHDQFDDDIPF